MTAYFFCQLSQLFRRDFHGELEASLLWNRHLVCTFSVEAGDRGLLLTGCGCYKEQPVIELHLKDQRELPSANNEEFYCFSFRKKGYVSISIILGMSKIKMKNMI